jgi:hypothetical protein
MVRFGKDMEFRLG